MNRYLASKKPWKRFESTNFTEFLNILTSLCRHYNKDVNDRTLVEEWKKTESELFNEMNTVGELKNIVQGFKVISFLALFSMELNT